MPRKPRFYIPGVPVHLIQRGNNRQACFFCDQDYRVYLHFLGEAAKRYGCQIHAYVIMSNHVHLLMTPSTSTAISKAMQSVGRHYVLYVNRIYQRTGTLWEGRHKACPIDSDSYLLACYRYIELNPVRAGMVRSPADYRWSSYRHHAVPEPDPRIEDHALYQALGRAPEERARAYRELFSLPLDSPQMDAIRTAVNVGFPLGNNRFKDQVAAALQCKVGYAYRGRPRKDMALRTVDRAREPV
jgi:putative transposase